MTINRLKLNSLLILYVVFIFGEQLLAMEAKADEIDKPIITTKEAILISLTEIERLYGKLPTRFKILVEEETSVIEVSIIWIPVKEGGSLTITISKKTGEIVERIKGQ